MAFIQPRIINMRSGTLTIRTAQIFDAENMVSFIQKAESETDFLTRSPGEISMSADNERKYIEDMLGNPRELLLIAIWNGRLAGTLGFTASSLLRYRHKGQFGISILRDYWGLGIGRKLIETLLEWTDNNGFIKVTLDVDTINQRAIHLYQSLGFSEEGFLKADRLMENNEFRNSFVMARFCPYYSH